MDFFLARYYSPAEGRFITPDWASRPEPVPYAKLNNPQTLNLYAYVGNNPLNRTDPDGHEEKCGFFCKIGRAVIATAADFSITEGIVRQNYNEKLNPNLTSAQRKELKLEMRKSSTPLGKAIAEAHDAKTAPALAAKTPAQLAESAGRPNPLYNALGSAGRMTGPILGGLAIGISAYNIYTASPEERGRVIAGEVGGLGGAVVGGRAGMAAGVFVGGLAGSETGPGAGGTAIAGGAIGAIGGAIVGGTVGEHLSEHLYDEFSK